jgi:hypothetical protein
LGATHCRQHHDGGPRSIATGLSFRLVADTVRATLAWVQAERGGRPFTITGLRAPRERELIAKLRAPAGK